QLEALLDTDIGRVEIAVPALLDDAGRDAEIARVRTALDASLARGEDVVLYTSRALVTGADSAASLAIGQRVSASLVAVVSGLTVRPRYLLAKGGITSSDLATAALGIRRAWVMGQVLPGVPVWRAGEESKYPGLSYIVFPGNVGGVDALVDVRTRLAATSGTGA
ncbi:MAG: hypothetical protein KDD83_17875, partial [Caldilineaceae bacterium]|nr:hypothetical protein [Caldilineaceae bacterium]